MKNITKTAVAASLLIVGLGLILAVSGCGQNSKSGGSPDTGAQERFELPAVAGGSTTFKDVEKLFLDACATNYESVAVVSIGLNCEGKKITHHQGALMDPESASSATARRVIDDFNRQHSGTVLDGIDIKWKVDVCVTKGRKKAAGTAKPLSVEWLCPNPSTTGKWPNGDSLSGVALAGSKYGINFTQVSSATFLEKGVIGVGQGMADPQGQKPFKVTLSGDPSSHPGASPTVEVQSDDNDVNTRLHAWATDCWNNIVSSYEPTEAKVVVTDLTYHGGGLTLAYTEREAYVNAKLLQFVAPSALKGESIGDTIVLEGNLIHDYASKHQMESNGKFQISGTSYYHDNYGQFYVRSVDRVE